MKYILMATILFLVAQIAPSIGYHLAMGETVADYSKEVYELETINKK